MDHPAFEPVLSEAGLLALLEKTSRTFALSIPPLPEPTRQEVTVAYLLFRIADTFEDAAHRPPEDRIRALEEFCELLGDAAPSPSRALELSSKWSSGGWAEHAGYRKLLGEIPDVLDALRGLSPGAVDAIRGPVVRSACGMAQFVARTREGCLALASLDDLKSYCYVVAGLVGEMLTDLFLLGRPALESAAHDLKKRAASFGEALQLVNILKDAAGDAAEGRSYLPGNVPVAEVFALARRDLEIAGEYIQALERVPTPRGILEFAAVPVQLAWATLERIQAKGPGAKLSRPDVYLLVRRVRQVLDSGASLGSLRP